MTLNAFIEPTRTGYSGYVIQLGAQVIAVGKTPDEVMRLLTEATEEIFDDLKRSGKPLPQPTVEVRPLKIA